MTEDENGPDDVDEDKKETCGFVCKMAVLGLACVLGGFTASTLVVVCRKRSALGPKPISPTYANPFSSFIRPSLDYPSQSGVEMETINSTVGTSSMVVNYSLEGSGSGAGSTTNRDYVEATAALMQSLANEVSTQVRKINLPIS